MAFLKTFETVIRKVSDGLEAVALAALLLMMFITCIDVVGSKLFLYPIFGALDVVQLSQLVAISFGAASSLILGRHVQVDFFLLLLPVRLRAAIAASIHLMALGFFILMVWRLFVFGSETGGEVTATARIPLSPFAYSIAAASIAGCFVFLLEFFKNVIKIGKP
ncbi:MAG: TRAP transporter small permease [Desulfobacterota bacterium]|nr:TRAP transporter small permease [Thermodesulfobacteriota bacterium]